MRLINTSVDTAFIFAIDNHKITVVGADFVPIKPYVTDHVVVGIGQRYHVIVEAHAKENSAGDNYWIRTIPAEGCGRFNNGLKPDEKTGIVRYKHNINTDDPVTEKGSYSLKCRDEAAENLVPILNWTVGSPENLGTLFITSFLIVPF